MAKEYFKSKNIEYDEFNVAEDAAKRDELMKKTGRMSVPVIIIGGDKMIFGFDKSGIDKALKDSNLIN